MILRFQRKFFMKIVFISLKNNVIKSRLIENLRIHYHSKYFDPIEYELSRYPIKWLFSINIPSQIAIATLNQLNNEKPPAKKQIAAS